MARSQARDPDRLQQPAPDPAGPPPQADLGPRVLAAAGWTVFGLLVIDQLGHGPLRALDAPLMRLIPHDGVIHTVSGIATHIGDQPVLVALTLLGTVVLLERRAFIDAGVLTLAKAVSVVVVYGFKFLFGRARPPMGPEAGLCCAFPSGHAAGSAMVLILLAVLLFERNDRWRPWAEGVAIGLALVVGGTRVILAVHWPTDVVAGWGLGWGLAGTFLLLRTYLQRKKVLADVAPGERVADGVGLRLSQGIHVHDEARVPIALEDVPEHGPPAAAPDPLHPKQEGLRLQRLVAGQHHP